MMDKQVKVLQITVGGTEYTGVASFMIQYYSSMDRTKVHYDFLFCRENSMELQRDNPILAGSKFYELKAIKKNGQMDYMSLFIKLQEVLKKTKYDIVHINTSAVITAFICLLVSKMMKVKTVIVHSHNDGVGKKQSEDGKVTKVIKKTCRKYIVEKSDWLFSCSLNAARYLFGEVEELSKFRVIKNAIDADSYAFNELAREKIREEAHVKKDSIVLGHVGRISAPKNHRFIVDIFKAFHEVHPNSSLWLVGDGENREKIIEYIQENKLESYVKMWGEQKNVSCIMQGMDIFVFPSLWEGFGLVAVEAQASGLQVFASEKVPNEVDVTDLVKHISLSNDASTWAEIISNNIENILQRKDTSKEIKESGYDISSEAKSLQDFFLKCKY